MKLKLTVYGLILLFILIVWGVAAWPESSSNKKAFATGSVLASKPSAIITPNSTFIPGSTALVVPIIPTTTPTPTLTLTTTPTPTMTSTTDAVLPNQLGTVLENPRIVFYDKFNPLNDQLWSGINHVSISNGLLEYVTTTDGGSLIRQRVFSEGTGVLLDFKYSKEIAYFAIFFTSGTFGDPTYRDFGFALDSKNGFQTNSMVSGNTWLGSTPNWTHSNAWYRLAMGVGKDGLIMLIWQRDNPASSTIIFRSPKGINDFSGLDWTFRLGGSGTNQQVTVDFENYYEIAFTKIY
jgi:hypothetical protein